MTLKSDIDPITAQLRSEEKTLRRRIVLFTLIPVAVCALLIWFTSSQVISARKTLEGLKDSVDIVRIDTRDEIDSLKALKEAVYAELKKVTDSVSAARTETLAIERYRARPRVYLHILMETQRPSARRLQSAIESAGLAVPGIERVAKGPTKSELRFFREEDSTKAVEIKQLAAEHVRLNLYDLSDKYGLSVRSGTFEIWLGPDFQP